MTSREKSLMESITKAHEQYNKLHYNYVDMLNKRWYWVCGAYGIGMLIGSVLVYIVK